MPSLLHLNIERNLEPKVMYLRSQLGDEGLSAALQRMPMLLAYSLEKRIRPRMEMVLGAGLEGGAITVGIPKGEEAFCRWLEARERKGQAKPRKSQKENGDAHDDVDASLNELPPQSSSFENERDDSQGIVHWTRSRRTKNPSKTE